MQYQPSINWSTEMKNATVIVVEKPSALKTLAPHLQAKYPGPLYAICTLYIGLYKFQYARGLRMHEFPVIAEPRWVPRADLSGEFNPVFELNNGTVTRAKISPLALLKEASQIVFAAEPDSSGAVAFHVLLSQALGEQAALEPREALYLMELSPTYLQNAVANPSSTNASWFVAMRNAGLARRFFDYNFNTNSLALLSPRTVRPGEYLMSKYSLQLLFGLRARQDPQPTSEGAVISLMRRWPGTGKYEPVALGSEASRFEIYSGLCLAGLVEAQRISDAGDAYLKTVHPDCEDADLPARLSAWADTWPESKDAMTRYLRMYFMKQARFRTRQSSYPNTTI